MNREILFRGKRVDNGKWVYGSYVEDALGAYIHVHEKRDHEKSCTHIDQNHGIVPETVGQYTGLTDKNGVKVFEGDLVVRRIERMGENARGRIAGRRGIITYSECGEWYIEPLTCSSQSMLFSSKIEVIGNIHDNPELTGQEAQP